MAPSLWLVQLKHQKPESHHQHNLHKPSCHFYSCH
uniref:Uncharacterized protein n=1 Tax=Arundo donax TaxID=35708 RepID=A0A0A8ZHW1_ARUDO